MQRMTPHISRSGWRKLSGNCPDAPEVAEPVSFEWLSGLKRRFKHRTETELSSASGRQEGLHLVRTFLEAHEAHLQQRDIAEHHTKESARYYEEFRFPNSDDGMYYTGEASPIRCHM